jgi:hypothetical protein
MHVVIGSTGMQQGLAFYQRLLLLKILEFFNSGVLHKRILRTTHSQRRIQWKQIRNSTPIISNSNKNNRKLFYSSRRSRGHKER